MDEMSEWVEAVPEGARGEVQAALKETQAVEELLEAQRETFLTSPMASSASRLMDQALPSKTEAKAPPT